MAAARKGQSNSMYMGLSAGEWCRVRGLLHQMVEQTSPQYRAKFDSSDIVQQTLLEACRSWDDFRGTTDAELASWLRKMVARNLLDAVRRLRSQKRSVTRERQIQAGESNASRPGVVHLVSDLTSPSLRVAKSEQLLQMSAAVNMLPADQQQAITLHHFEGKTLVEVAEQMQRSRASVAGLLQRGLRTLRQTMDDRHEV